MRSRFLTSVVLAVMSAGFAFAAEPTELAKGKIADDSLRHLAPKSGVISDAGTFAKLWNAWRPKQAVPEIDFTKDLVLVGVAHGPNLVMFHPKLQEDGDLKYVVASTKMGGPGFGYRMVKLSREGIKTVNGKSVEKGVVQGTIAIPDSATMQKGQTIQIKFFEFDPLLADASATLIDEKIVTNIQHKTGKATELSFAVGADFEPRKDRRYYITVFALQDNNRTHMGEIDGKRGLNVVLQEDDRSPVNVIMRQLK